MVRGFQRTPSLQMPRSLLRGSLLAKKSAGICGNLRLKLLAYGFGRSLTHEEKPET